MQHALAIEGSSTLGKREFLIHACMQHALKIEGSSTPGNNIFGIWTGLVNPVGSPASKGVVSLALRSGARPPPDLLGLCAAVDEKAAALLSARDQSLLAATAALQVQMQTCQLPSLLLLFVKILCQQ